MSKENSMLKLIFLISMRTGETPQEVIKRVCKIANIPQGNIKIVPRI